MVKLNTIQEELCSSSKWGFSNIKALFLNCTLKKSSELSHTEGLMNVSKNIMEKVGVSVELVRVVDYDVAYGVYPGIRQPKKQVGCRLQI